MRRLPRRADRGEIRARHLVAAAALALALVASTPAFSLTNGDFSAGLAGWSTTGVAAVSDGALRLADDGPTSSSAWQVVAAEATRSRLSFDVKTSLSDFTPEDPFGFPDVFAVSIQLFDEAADFDPSDGTALSAVLAVSFDWQGPYDVAASLAPAARGDGWMHVDIEFDSIYGHIAPVFDLFELGIAGGDSYVLIDDIEIAAVPEPGTGVLLMLGLAVTAWQRRSRAVEG